MIPNYRKYKDLRVIYAGGKYRIKHNLLDHTEWNLVRAFLIPNFNMGLKINQL